MMQPGTILGHEGVGIVEKVGPAVRNINAGDRVVIPSTIACGYCSYCRAGYFAQCDHANPNGPAEGTAFYGGPKSSGPFDGLQAEYARVPFAGVGCVKIPEEVGDDDAILLSDIFPTAYFGAELAEVCDGNTVAIFGCGPVGLFAIRSAQLRGAGRIFAIDTIASRLDKARELGAEVIDFNAEDPIEAIKQATGNIGVDRVIDAVGVDAVAPKKGPAARKLRDRRGEFAEERKRVAPKTKPKDGNWEPGDAPSMALEWALECVAKAGTLGIIGVYNEEVSFPIANATEKNLTLRMGNCNHRRYIPKLVELVRSGAVRPSEILSHRQPLADVIEAYKAFDKREPGWIKVELEPEREAA